MTGDVVAAETAKTTCYFSKFTQCIHNEHVNHLKIWVPFFGGYGWDGFAPLLRHYAETFPNLLELTVNTIERGRYLWPVGERSLLRNG